MRFIPIPSLTDKDVRRVWSKVARSGTEGECWIWQGELDRRYGKISFRRNSKKVEVKAHRVVYYLTTGLDPLTKVVCHTCDNPPCCNPAHLFVGTQGDNLRDMHRKGRARPRPRKGEESPTAKLTEEKIKEIRERYAAGDCTHRELAADYGVARSLIGRVLGGSQWTHVTDGQKVETVPRDWKLRFARLASRLTEAHGLTLKRGLTFGFDVETPDGRQSVKFQSLADIERTYFGFTTNNDGRKR